MHVSLVQGAARCLLAVLLAWTWQAGAAEVRTLAGRGAARCDGDGGPALEAGVHNPFGVVVGPDGAVYVCEVGGHVIRRIDRATGIASTIAGLADQPGWSGDGGPAKDARLNEPYEIRFDAQGDLYVVEMQNHLVRKIEARTGLISTVAGRGRAGFSGDGGPAIDAEFRQPHSIVLAGEAGLLICDIGNHRIRRVDLNSGRASTFAGNGARTATPDGAPLDGTPLNGPRALDFDGQDSLYLALREGNAVYRIDLTRGTLHHIAGSGKQGFTGDGGDARQATLAGPKGIAVGPDGDVYLADTENHAIRVIRRKSGIIETIVGDGQPGDGPDGDPLRCRLSRPHGVFVDAVGRVLIGDSENHRVREFVPEAAAPAR
ncbi:MAG: hypothetical protein KF774_19215 [Planctomyces sp.]|nr:hypothetical protein [Planctomyces sp.]